jgi:transcriptional regulator with XRE-family HTH domain
MDTLGQVIGGRIKNVREKARMSQSELAVNLGVTASLISQYERGMKKPSVDVLLHISRQFGCSIDFLFGAAAESIFIDDDVVSIFVDFKALSRRDKAVIKEIISTMCKIPA